MIRHLIHVEIYGILTNDIEIRKYKQDKKVGIISVAVYKKTIVLEKYSKQIFDIYIFNQALLYSHTHLLKAGAYIKAVCELDLLRFTTINIKQIIINIKHGGGINIFPDHYLAKEELNVINEDLSEYKGFLLEELEK